MAGIGQRIGEGVARRIVVERLRGGGARAADARPLPVRCRGDGIAGRDDGRPVRRRRRHGPLAHWSSPFPGAVPPDVAT